MGATCVAAGWWQPELTRTGGRGCPRTRRFVPRRRMMAACLLWRACRAGVPWLYAAQAEQRREVACRSRVGWQRYVVILGTGDCTVPWICGGLRQASYVSDREVDPCAVQLGTLCRSLMSRQRHLVSINEE